MARGPSRQAVTVLCQSRRLLTSEAARKKPLPSPARRRSLDLALIGLGVAAVSGVFILSKPFSSTPAPQAAPESRQRTFTIPLPGVNSNGERQGKTLALMSQSQVEAKLHEHEESFTLNRPNNPVFRFDTSWLASNAPIEDDHSTEILSRDKSAPVAGDLVLFGVFDGHAGWQTSRLVAEKLVQYVVRELHAVFGAAPEYEQMRLDRMAADTAKQDSQGKLGYLASLIKGGGVVRDQRGLHLAHLDQDDAIVQQAIKNAFLKLDDDICQAPVKELANAEEGASARRRPILPSTSQTLALQSLLPALSGSCALLSYLDTARNKLHVACTGDSRAIMGTLQADGKWRVQVLSEDQTGRSAKEVARMQAEHPASEKETVISRGRVLGGLEPTRAFGDAVYKYEPGLYNRLIDALHPGSARRMRPNCSTPPYVTARPEVVTTDLLPAPTEKNLAQPRKRFIVMATDGLWDRLENDTVVGLVGAWLDGHKGAITEKQLLDRVTPDSTSKSTASHTPNSQRSGQFVFEDANLSTHLIRNALGGADQQALAALLSIPAPLSRRFRDDITATVILLGEEDSGHPEGVRRTIMTTKAKL